MHLVISLPEDEAAPWMDLFRAALPEASLSRHEPGTPPDARAQRADYVIAAYPSATLFAEQPAPKAIFTVSAGVGHVLKLPNLPRDAPLIRVEDAGMAAQMIRYVVTAAMRYTQRLDTYRRQQHAAEWKQHSPRGPSQIVAGVLGLGVIGSAIARALATLHFDVRGYSRSMKAVEGVRCHAGEAGFPQFLDGLDFLCAVLPSTPQTAGLLDRDALTRLADGAHVVNVGRGDLIVDDDLLALVDSGKLSGATLDVFRKEPLPAEHPYWQRPQITVTPHVSGLTVPDETVTQIAGKIRALERGESVTGVVDVALGY